MEQFEQFSSQRDDLNKRMEELDTADASIRDLITALDQRKDEAIMRTFKGVQKNFREVFAALVPKGSGTLVIRTDAAAAAGSASGEAIDDAENAPSAKKKGGARRSSAAGGPGGVAASAAVDRFTGMGVNVSFTDGEEQSNIDSLSGGQKALVSLALIFAIQRADPAPFYLFDEIDSALDETHRAAVANLIRTQAHAEENPAQFICTTFRPELVEQADAWLAVVNEHKVSDIQPQEQSDALAFIATLIKEERAVGAAAGAAAAGAASAPRTAGRLASGGDAVDADSARAAKRQAVKPSPARSLNLVSED